jgi:chitinase
MSVRLSTVACLSALLLVATSASHAQQAAAPAHRTVGYLASWGVKTKGTRIAELPADRLTHLFYAFALIGSDGRIRLGDRCLDTGACGANAALPNTPRGNFGELAQLKKRHPHLKLLISLGGWGGSARFSDAALTDSTRRVLVTSTVDLFIRRWPGLFDGIDVDWEFPVRGGMKGNVERPEDRANFTLLLAEFRRQLDEQGAREERHYELTIAASARPSEIANIEVERVAPLLDFINVMTYDYHVGSTVAHFNAPLRAGADDPTPHLTIESSVRAFRDAGVPASKLLVGVPFYGRAFGGVHNVAHGRFQPVGEPPKDIMGSDLDWKQLSRRLANDARFVTRWDSAARVPFAYDSSCGTWISYDDERSVREKSAYVREQGLGGIIIWELGGDDGRLIRAVSEGLRGNAGAPATR